MMKMNKHDEARGGAGGRKMLLHRTILAAQIALQVVMPLYAWLPGIAMAVENNKPADGTLIGPDEIGELVKNATSDETVLSSSDIRSMAQQSSLFDIWRDYGNQTGAEKNAPQNATLSSQPDSEKNAPQNATLSSQPDSEKNASQNATSSSSGTLPLQEQLPNIGDNQELHDKPADTAVSDKQQFNRMTEDWGTAARIAVSDDTTAAARGFAIGGTTGYAAGAVQKWLQQFGTAKVNINVDDSMKFEDSSLDFLYPLYESASRLLFTQAGGRYSDDRWMANLGVGQRHFLRSWMVGYNLFFDQDLTEDHSRAGTGLEFWGDDLKLSANGYYRITSWKDSSQIDHYQARPANGFDLKVEGYLPAYPQLGGSVGYEKYYGNDVALFGHDNDRQKNPSAFSYGLTYTPVPFVEFDTIYKDGQDGLSDTQFDLQFNYAFGVPFAEQFDPDGVAIKRSLAGSRYDFVDRNNTIVLNYRNNGKIRLLLPATVSGQGNTTVNLQASVQSDNGLDHIAWDDATLRSAGGSISGSGASYSVHLPSYIPNSVNTYMLSGIAYDKAGHTSSSASTAISVLASEIDPSDAQVSVSPSSINANGVSTSTLTIILQDEQGNALTGQADGFTFNLSGSATQQSVSSLRHLTAASKAASIGTVKEVSSGKYQATITAGTTAGNLVVTPYLNGSTLPTATLVLTADSSDAVLKSASLIVNPDNSVADGETLDQAQVTVVDANGNPVPGINVNWSLPTDNTTASLTAASSVTNSSGIATIGIKDLTAESVLLTAAVNGSELSAPVNFTQYDNSAVIQANSLTVKDASTLADGKSTKTATVTVVDGTGHPLDNIQVGWAVSGSAILADGENTGSSVTASDGIATITLTDTKAESVEVTATVNGQSVPVSSTFIPDSKNAVLKTDSLVIEQNGSPADGKSSDMAQVTVVDENGNPVPDINVNWSLPSDNKTASLTATSSFTDSRGIATVGVKDLTAESVLLTATVHESELSAPVNFTQYDNSAVIQANSLTVKDASTLADGKSTKTATVTVVDGTGHPLDNIQVGWAVSGSAILADGENTGSSVTASDGIATITLTDTKAESVEVTATVNGQSVPVSSTFIPDSKNAVLKTDSLVIEQNGSPSDGKSSDVAQVMVVDEQGNAVPGISVTWSLPDGNTTAKLSATSTTTDASGETVVDITDTKAETLTVTVALGSDSQSKDISFTQDNDSAKIENGSYTLTDSSTPADGSTPKTATVVVVDGNGTPLNNVQVSWTVTGAALFSNGSSTDTSASGTDGTAGVQLTDTKAETVTVSVSVNHQEQSLTSAFVPAEALVKKVIISKDNSIADGHTQNSAIAFVLDAQNNPVPNANVTWSSTSKTIIYYAETNKVKTDQYGSATIKYSDTTAGSQTLTATLDDGQTRSATTQFAVDPGTVSISSIELVSPTGSKAIADGSSTYTYKAKVADNISPTEGIDVTWSLSGSTAKFVGGVNKTTSDSDGYATISFTDTKAETVTLTATLDNDSQKSQSGIEFIKHYSITAKSVSSGWASADTTFSDSDEYATLTVNVVDNTTGKAASSGVTVTADTDSEMVANHSTVTMSNGSATFKFASTLASTHAIDFLITADASNSKGTGTATIIASPRWPMIREWVSVNNQHVKAKKTVCDVSTTEAARDQWGNSYTSSTPTFDVTYYYESNTGRNDSKGGFLVNGQITHAAQTATLQWNGNVMSVDENVCAFIKRQTGDNTMDVSYSVHAMTPSTIVLNDSAHFPNGNN